MSSSTALVAVKSGELTYGEALFVEAYLADKFHCPTAAAKTAGYTNPTAIGKRMLSKAAVQKAINDGFKKRVRVFQVDADDVLRQLHAIAMADPSLYFENEKVIPVNLLADHMRAAIKGVRLTYGEEVADSGEFTVVKHYDYVFHDKMPALTLLMKHCNLLNDEQKQQLNLAIAASGQASVSLNWDALVRPPQEDDAIEARLSEEESQ